MNSLKASVCCVVLCGAAVAAPREKVIFDTDIGGDVDDALALSYLVCEPRCELMGVTIEGDAPDKKADIASAICTAFGRADIPVYPGCSRPIWGNHKFRNSTRYWPVVTNRPHAAFTQTNSAVDFLRRTIRENPGQVTLVATGHFTNLGVLFALDVEIPSLLKRLVLMGGDLDGRCEWNAMCDPVATAIAFGNGNCRRPPETVVFPASATRHHIMSPQEGRAFMARMPAIDICAAAAEYWYRDGCKLGFHDPMAAVGVFHPEIATYTSAAVSVAVTGKGVTRYSKNAALPRLKVATEIDFERFKSEFVRVLSAAKSGNR